MRLSGVQTVGVPFTGETPCGLSLCLLQMVNNMDKGDNDDGGYKVSGKDRGLKRFSLQTAILMGTNYHRVDAEGWML